MLLSARFDAQHGTAGFPTILTSWRAEDMSLTRSAWAAPLAGSSPSRSDSPRPPRHETKEADVVQARKAGRSNFTREDIDEVRR
jgi:hypothetical protein